MKSVLISILPKWVEKIASGEKTIEIRKTKPKLETPFKCFIYETQGETETPWVDEDGHLIFKGRGAVIGEFVCDRITKYPHEHYTDGEHLIPYDDFEQIGMDGIELYNYLRVNDGYGWHISDLKIYDKPKELNFFKCVSRYAVEKVVGSGSTPCIWVNKRYLIYLNNGCVYDTISAKDIPKYVFDIRDEVMSNNEYCLNRSIVRAPQSWCYVEE